MISHVLFDHGDGTSASSTNCLIAGRARDISLICRLSSGGVSGIMYSFEWIYIRTNWNNGAMPSKISGSHVGAQDRMG